MTAGSAQNSHESGGPAVPGKVLVVGLGLIGGSFAAAMKKAGCPTVLGWDRHAETGEKAVALKQVDIADTALDRLPVVHTDLIFIAVPPRQLSTVVKKLKGLIDTGAVVTDACSVKAEVVEQVQHVFGRMPPNFVPGHPVAGSDRSGIDGADPELFRGSRTVLTPLEVTRTDAVEKVSSLWQRLGCEVVLLSPEEHDRRLALSSHLPHLAAYALMEVFADETDDEAMRLSRRGLGDTTRIAKANPALWRDICLENRPALLETLDRYRERLDIMRRHLADADGKKLKAQFSRARKMRMALEEKGLQEHFAIDCGGEIRGRLRPPPDKSISHRALMLGALAEGDTVIQNFLPSEDCKATLTALRALGVQIDWPGGLDRVKVHGSGGRFFPPAGPLDLGNSGTAARLLLGLLAKLPFEVELSGDDSLQRRPMERVIEPLRKMGMHIDAAPGERLPLRIRGGQVLRGIHWPMPMASAQVKSSLLLAGLQASGRTEIIEPAPCRDHTERMLEVFGCPVTRDGNTVAISGESLLHGDVSLTVPGDFSSAMFALVAACLAPNADLELVDVGINPTRIGGLEILRRMGAQIEVHNERISCGEPIADIRLRGDTLLRGIEIPIDLVPLAIDEFPVLFIAAACAEGETVLKGARELRVKESDRITAMATGLAQLGVRHRTEADGIRIWGGLAEDATSSGEVLVVDCAGDHRIAMAFAVAALRCSRPLVIANTRNVATSWPSFPRDMHALGLRIK